MSTQAPSIVADIGATNARFSLADATGLAGEPVVLDTAAYDRSESLVEDALSALGQPAPQALCLAIAGPVREGHGRMTNGALVFDAAGLERRLGAPVLVVNDFHALARGLPALRHARQLGGNAPGSGLKAVLGPGTGLGMGLLAPLEGGWRVLASEGGHAHMAPGSPLETELLSVMQAEHGYVSWEMVLSGPGLVRLYRATCQIWGASPDDLSSEQISARGVTAADPVCHQTLETFFALLGAAAGNLALTVYALGGVYLGGGIVPHLAEFAAESPLRRRFDERGAMTGLIREVPLYLILDDCPGLVGALAMLGDVRPQ
ncbi:MAG: ROK family protein [Pseudomonadota bacterium]